MLVAFLAAKYAIKLTICPLYEHVRIFIDLFAAFAIIMAECTYLYEYRRLEVIAMKAELVEKLIVAHCSGADSFLRRSMLYLMRCLP